MLSLALLAVLTVPPFAHAGFLPDTSPEFAEWRQSWPEWTFGRSPS